LEQSIGRTLEALDNLSDPALEALKDTAPDPFLYWLKLNLGILHTSAKELKVNIKVKMGAPKEAHKLEIARFVGMYYHSRTGKKPTVRTRDGKAYGPFLETLACVYKIIGVQGGGETQARAVAREWGSKV
jgi:hypothetical protein